MFSKGLIPQLDFAVADPFLTESRLVDIISHHLLPLPRLNQYRNSRIQDSPEVNAGHHKMCYRRRTIFQCNHIAWGGVAKACEAEKAFKIRSNAATSPACGQIWPHALCSRRVPVECGRCLSMRKKTDAMLSELKRRIEALRVELKAQQAFHMTRTRWSAGASPSSAARSATPGLGERGRDPELALAGTEEGAVQEPETKHSEGGIRDGLQYGKRSVQ